MKTKKSDYLKTPVVHIDPTSFNTVPLIESMKQTAFQARNLARAAEIYDKMIQDKECAIILCLAGSLVSAGLKKTIYELIANNMVDAIVSTGAIMVDQDFFEALGFRHYIGTQFVDDNELRELMIDRIYDTYINEEELRICDSTVTEIADSLEPRPYSSREFIHEMGRWLSTHAKERESIVLLCYEKGIPIFVPAFSDCSAGFGFVLHQTKNPESHVSIDSAKDFLELTQIKVATKESGLVMIGGGVPKNFAQDVVVAADLLGVEAPMHKYAIQLTVADERDGALSGSTLKEASSWGKVETTYEQMVFGEATITLPILASYVYHQRHWEKRQEKSFNQLLSKSKTAVRA
ncbi:deoxyhypusine synthase [Candidatus Acetothermia bacterium]|nr:deoxyhypusine synthase [Candidatus Acetothermia bacterium]MBI3643811.1 deoxyhypusine synthase [Candidatus Acetothermia bacterium]